MIETEYQDTPEVDIKIDLDTGSPSVTDGPEPTAREQVTTGLLAISLSLHEGPTTKLDREMTDAAAAKTGADKGRVRSYKTTLTHSLISALRNVQKRIRKLVDQYTVATGQDGVRILRASQFNQFIDRYNSAVDGMNTVRHQLSAEYDTIVLKQVEGLQGAYKKDDYLTRDEYMQRWGVELSINPVVSPDQISGLAEEIVTRMEDSHKAMLEKARKDVWARLVSVTGILSHTLHNNERFHQSQWDALTTFIDAAPELSPEKDDKLTEHLTELKQWVTEHPREVVSAAPTATAEAEAALNEKLAALKADFGVL